MDQSSAAQNRKSNRSPVLLIAKIAVGGDRVAVRLRNLSAKGALIEADALPMPGSQVVFERNELRVKALIVWTEGRFAGLAFERPLEREELLCQVPQPRPKLDQPYRRPGLACEPLSEADRRMIQMWSAPSALRD